VLVVCEGDDTVTLALAIGAPDFASVTTPFNPPVVPASAHVSWASTATANRTATNTCRNLIDLSMVVSM
jgi:hypothetical protein